MPTDWVKDRLTFKNLAILDARSKGAYLTAHIPGALHADLFHYFVPGTDKKGLKKFHSDLARRLSGLGLTGKETVVVYESKFGMRAARVAWMLEYAGFSRVFLLGGGFHAWRKGGFSVEKRPSKAVATEFVIKPKSSILATADSIVSSKSKTVLDVRTEGEYLGSEKRDCCERYGRIPASTWLEWTNFIENDERFADNEAVHSLLRQKGLKKEKGMVVYCHRGARAAAAFYALRSAGFSNVKNYIGSWHEWSSRKSLPIELGKQD